MTDIRQRLISAAETARSSQFGAPASICMEAADEIGRLRAAALSPPEPTEGQDIVRDAARYRRLQVLGCAPAYSTSLDSRTVLRFTNLDEFVDLDMKHNPSRGEAHPLRALPLQDGSKS